MKIEYKLTIEVDQEGYDQLITQGYNEYQVRYNILMNIRAMFGMLQKHWYRVIYDIDIEEIEKNDDAIRLCQNKY